ncbi:MAG: PilZ domain-containing protein [Elusimicrobia bacterium]|nr:PilZ domain-containing protein [Elusimicrobiota bacterium]
MDKRRHARRDSGAELILAGRQYDIEDLSPKGLRLYSDARISVGQKLPFSLKLPGGPHVHGLAQVRWSDEGGWRKAHGLEFVKIGRLGERSIVKYLNPRYFGLLEAFDVALEFAFCLALFFAVRAYLNDPVYAAMLTDLGPWAIMASGIGLGGYFLGQT